MDTRKIVQALTYFAYNQPECTLDKRKAYKLLWLADRWQLRHSGRFLSNDRYFAMPKGPVPSDAKKILEGKDTYLNNNSEYVAEHLELGTTTYAAKKCPDLRVFSISDREALEKVLNQFGDLSSSELSSLSHKFPEWIAYEERINDKSPKRSFPIDIDLFFKDPATVLDEGFFEDDAEALELARELYHRSNRI